MASQAEGAEQALQPGALIGGRFRVDAILGQGGMGAVYRVQDERAGRSLALKQLRTGGHNSATAKLMVSQFEREYHTLCQLAHPSIIEVYDYGVDGPTVFYTMELLDGQDLRERGRLPWREACAIFRDVASSLAVMHSRRLLHRDISARNVRCTTTGAAKLIDFGAMAPMGLVKYVVGTAPFVPPEALQLQMLDGRSDLYALGVLAYWVLAGRYPYPAHALADLPNLWRNAPANLRRYDPQLPEALDQLVMELIELDRNARPVSAAEVMERLSGIAGLALGELPEVGRAYLVAPTLIGREAPLQAVRTKLVRALQGGGGSSFLIEGAEGSGRSRLLDACVLEAKLLGATVLRADASDAEGGAYGVAKALCSRLFEELPRVARKSARPWRSVLERLLPELSPEAQQNTSLPPGFNSLPPDLTAGAAYSMVPPPAMPSDRAPEGPAQSDLAPDSRTLQSALRDFLLSVARSKHLVFAVDDVDAIDLPSAALLGALAHGAKRRRLTLLASCRSTAPRTPALTLLREIAQPIALEPLTLDQCELLLRSVFGDAGRLPTLNERLFALAGGNPRWTMALCEGLVDRGLARYEAGGWRLPIEIGPDDLPPSLADASLSKIAALPPDALGLAEALCLCDPAQLPLDKYPLLTDHGDSGRVYRAIEQLVAAGLLRPQGDRYRFSQQGAAAALAARIDAARAPALHCLVARAHENCDDPWRVPYHLLLGGREQEGIQVMGALREDPRVTLSKVSSEAAALAAAAAQRLGYPRLTQLRLQLSVVGLALLHVNYPRFMQYGWTLLENVLRDAGLRDYEALGEELPPAARLEQAQARTLRRYQETPEHERGHAPREAVNLLRALMWWFAGMASTAQELELVERLPSLEPLFPMLPLLALTQLQVEYQRHLQSGRAHLAEKTSRELLDRARKPDAASLNIGTSSVLHWELHNQGLFAASRGDSAALELVAELEGIQFHRAGARRVRMAYELMHGNVEEANALRRRAELLALEDGAASVLPGTSTRIELIVYSLTDDVIGVKRTMERLDLMAQRFQHWRPSFLIARSQYLRIQGDPNGALEALTSALQATAPGRHIDWALAATMHVALLNALSRSAEAVEHGLGYIEQCEQQQLLLGRVALLRVVGEGLTRVGRLPEALRMLNEHIAQHEALGTRGLQLGLAYEARARLAIASNDEANVRHYAELCAQEYKGARNPMLSTKYKGLMREAESAGLPISTSIHQAIGTTGSFISEHTDRGTQNVDHTLSSRLLGCVDRAERAREGLRLLLESTGAAGGFLFDLEQGGLELLASVEEGEPSQELLQAFTSLSSTQLGPDDSATSFDIPDDNLATSFDIVGDDPRTSFDIPKSGSPGTAFKDPSGRTYEPVLLKRERKPVMLAALRYVTAERRVLRRELLDAMVDHLGDDDSGVPRLNY